LIRIFNHHLPKGMLLLILAEISVLLLALPVTGGVAALRSGLDQADLAFALLMLSLLAAFGLYRRDFEEGLGSMVFRVLTSFAVGLFILVIVGWLVPGLWAPRGPLVGATVLALTGILLLRLTFFRWADLDALKHRILVLGTGTRAAKIGALLRDPDSRRRLHVVGFLPLQGTHHFVDHSLILPDQGPLTEIVGKYQIDEVVIAIRERRGGGLPVNELLDCKLNGIHVIELSTFFERERGQVQLESLNTSWMVLSEGFHQGLLRDIVKRTFDLTVSALILVVTLPLMLVAAILIVLESGFPLLYRQERVGLGGRVFTIYKFRSMTQNAEADGKPRWAQEGDARVTAIGKFIRKTRIDELPQLINVFKGDMSFVGPRPERPFFVNQLIEQVPYYASRHSIKPGITGWAQVHGHRGETDTLDKMQARVEYDLEYLRNWSLLLDLQIIARTIKLVFFDRQAY
jgi:sugar transferase (PEP-CTERM system associated)